jgi:methyl-accepting chemotaxis protein
VIGRPSDPALIDRFLLDARYPFTSPRLETLLMLNTIKARLIALCSGVVLLALLVATLASYFDARGHVRSQANAQLAEVARGQAQSIAGWMGFQHAILQSLRPAVDLENPRVPLAQAALSGGLDMAYIGHADKRMLQSKDQALPEGYDPTQRPWYKQAAGSDGVILTEPYLDASTQQSVVTFALAVKEGSGVKAVVASDVYLTAVANILKAIKPTPSGFAFLVAADGRVMAHSDPKRVLKPATELSPDLNPSALKALGGPQGEWLETRVGEQNVLLRSAPVAGTDWQLIVASDAAEALAALRSLLLKAVLVTVLMVALAAAVITAVVSALTSSLQRVQDAMTEISAGGGDLTRRLPAEGQDEVAGIARAFNDFASKLQGILRDVHQATGSMSVASGEIASGAQDLSHRTEQTASNLQQATSSMDTLTAAVRQTADAATTANQLAASASGAAQKGGSVVGQVVATMDDISTSSKRISDIIGVIDGIAFQTNILALNAAVEAARAGEQGRGFAVVASEVRSLAGRSAEAAKEIKSLISASVERVETGSRLVEEAGTAMGEIVSGVQRVSDIIGEISAAAAEQSQGIGNVNITMGQLDQATQQNAALVEESAAAAESLRDQAQRLSEIISVFQVGQVDRQSGSSARAASKPQSGAMRPAAPRAPSPPSSSAAPRPATPTAASKPAAARPAPKPAQTAAPATTSAPDGDWETF